jgi:hypothetical protein
MYAQREQVIEQLFTALAEHKTTADLEQEVIAHFDEYVRHQRFSALPLHFLLKIVAAGRLKIAPDDVCQLFINNVPYNGYGSFALLGRVNFHGVSTQMLLQMNEITGAEGEVMTLPMIVELIAVRDAVSKAQECGGARLHDFGEGGVCKRCGCGKCIQKDGCQLADVHNFGDDGRCTVCGAPRCMYDSLHVFDYDGHCHVCGRAQPTRCDIVGCQPAGSGTVCDICGKPVKKAE